MLRAAESVPRVVSLLRANENILPEVKQEVIGLDSDEDENTDDEKEKELHTCIFISIEFLAQIRLASHLFTFRPNLSLCATGSARGRTMGNRGKR